MKWRVNFLVIFCLFFAFLAYSAEPYFCQVDEFLGREIRSPEGIDIVRLHLFKIGKVYLAGMAVGKSDTREVQKLGRFYNAHSDVKYCTWYVNSGNLEAERIFVHKFIMNPLLMTADEAVNNFLFALKESFTTGFPSFPYCATGKNFISIGCHSQKHRGPAAFGMILSFLGCRPENSIKIVNRLWGLNGVKWEVRYAVLEAAYFLGEKYYPELREKMLEPFLEY